MTTDEIIRMAREAGISITTNWMGKPMLTSIGTHGDVGLKGTQELERFANLVAAAEQERRTEKYPIAFTHEEYNAVIEAAIADGAKTEREACANVCNDIHVFGMHQKLQAATIEDCVAAIRARGQA